MEKMKHFLVKIKNLKKEYKNIVHHQKTGKIMQVNKNGQ